MKNKNIDELRERFRAKLDSTEHEVLAEVLKDLVLTQSERQAVQEMSRLLIARLRSHNAPGLMEVFLAQYSLSSDEGVALMCLAESLLRVPDSTTVDELIEDRILSGNWSKHLGQSSSLLVNIATWGLWFTAKVLNDNQKNRMIGALRGAIKRLAKPIIRISMRHAMKIMGQQFVLGESIEAAVKRGESRVKQGYTYSFDMLGEAALTANDADNYFRSYANTIEQLSYQTSTRDILQRPGVSIKLSALHPRYEASQDQRVENELVPRVLALAQAAKRANITINIDAEEANRLDLSMNVIEQVFADSSLEGWEGFGVVVQAYNRRATYFIDWLIALAQKHQKRIMVRLVKGAYWDTEIKHAQVAGLHDFPVFTRKAATDVSFLYCAKKLLSAGKSVYPQFATHNAHTLAAILAIAQPNTEYEFQRLHGMGQQTFELLREQVPARCRIYAPVGAHRDLLAYLVRRLLENGANSSFVNRVADLEVPIEEVVADPFSVLEAQPKQGCNSRLNPTVVAPQRLFLPERLNSRGWDLHEVNSVRRFERARESYLGGQWQVTPLTVLPFDGGSVRQIVNPANREDVVGEVIEASENDVDNAISAAKCWDRATPQQRSDALIKVAVLLEENSGELFAMLAREAAKTPTDAVAEIREAVDFLRYYAAQSRLHKTNSGRGTFVCISPWNFPLAIFIGQIAAALGAGNAVVAKPAEATPLVASFATKLFHRAGVPLTALQLLPGLGETIGARLVSSSDVDGVCFTGSIGTGLSINRHMSVAMSADAPLIAETGGLNAMIVDSTALPEQVVTDVIRSAYQSAGQRCSALRLLYIQEDVYDDVLAMLLGAVSELSIGDPWLNSTDVGPLISKAAKQKVQAYVDNVAENGRLVKQLKTTITASDNFVGPAIVSIGGVADIPEEIFGPVLHVARFKAQELDRVIDEINASEYGLTFGLHTRIDCRVEHLVNRLNVGNLYVNRDQIGAVVGSQPFGGEGLSGTGPKAGGPSYVLRFMRATRPEKDQQNLGADSSVQLDQVQYALDKLTHVRTKLSMRELPGPTGESNRLYQYGRDVVLCLGADLHSANEQALIASDNGCTPLIVCPGASGENAIDGILPRALLSALKGIALVALWAPETDLSLARQALAARSGPIVPLVCDESLAEFCRIERHVCINTVAAGGNVVLLNAMA